MTQDNTSSETILNLNVDEAIDLIVMDDNTEAQLRIESAEIKHSQKDGSPYLNLRCSIPSEVTANDIYHIMMLPKDHEKTQNPKKFNMDLKRFKDLYSATGTPNGQVDIRELVGKEFYAILGVQEDDQYGKRNTIKRIVIPR
jgi:hypothetical protein